MPTWSPRIKATWASSSMALKAWSSGESPSPVSPAISRPQSIRKMIRWLWFC